jgi:hypothetical protein
MMELPKQHAGPLHSESAMLQLPRPGHHWHLNYSESRALPRAAPAGPAEGPGTRDPFRLSAASAEAEAGSPSNRPSEQASVAFESARPRRDQQGCLFIPPG